jgi:hypothetical protein
LKIDNRHVVTVGVCPSSAETQAPKKKHVRDGLRQLINVLGLVPVHVLEEPLLVEVVHRSWLEDA